MPRTPDILLAPPPGSSASPKPRSSHPDPQFLPSQSTAVLPEPPTLPPGPPSPFLPSLVTSTHFRPSPGIQSPTPAASAPPSQDACPSPQGRRPWRTPAAALSCRTPRPPPPRSCSGHSAPPWSRLRAGPPRSPPPGPRCSLPRRCSCSRSGRRHRHLAGPRGAHSRGRGPPFAPPPVRRPRPRPRLPPAHPGGGVQRSGAGPWET